MDPSWLRIFQFHKVLNLKGLWKDLHGVITEENTHHHHLLKEAQEPMETTGDARNRTSWTGLKIAAP